MAAQAEALVEKSAKSMEHQLTFLRYAFGSVGLQDGEADQHEVTRLLTEYAALNKCQVEWSGDAQTLTLKQSRLLMNMAMIGMTTVPRGGVLTLSTVAEGEKLKLNVTAKGDRINVRDEVLQVFAGQEPEGGWTAKNVQPYLARMIATELGGDLLLDKSDDAVQVHCTL